MASVFLSYDHDDRAQAAPIAAALEKAGHSVWWDQRIAAGAEYNSEIEEAVERADAVMVLWSERSVRSAWVRDEAAEGRDCGKLIPVTIDGTKPPMGFRQYQTIDVSRRKRGGGLQHLDDVLAAVGKMSEGDGGAPKIVRRPTAEQAFPRRRWPMLAAIAVAVLVVGGLLAWRMTDGSAVPVVAVMSAERSAEGDAIARNLLIKLGRLRSAKTDSVRLVRAAPGEAEDADFIFEAAASNDRDRSVGNLALLASKDRSVLWSKDFEVQGGTRTALEQSMAYTAGQILDCALEASKPGQERIDQDTLKLFLNGCALFAEKYRTDPQSVVPLFLQIVAKAPRFQPAWRRVLLAESLFTRTERLLNRHTPGELPRHIAAARRLNADIPELFVAESVLLPLTAYARRSELLERAVRLDSDNPDLLLMRAELNLGVGRNADVSEDVTRAVELNPLSPGLRSHMIASLAYVGRVETAFQELRRAEDLWPDSVAIEDARFRLNNRYGDPKLGLQMLKAGKMRLQPMVSPMVERFLIARIDPTEANVARAMTEAERRVSSDPRSIGDLIQTAGEFGREEQLYRVLLSWRNDDELRVLGEVLFRPTLAKFRQDPRFMRVAERARLVDYWRSSGKWPDFCFEPDLPYDCKAEAAKVATT